MVISIMACIVLEQFTHVHVPLVPTAHLIIVKSGSLDFLPLTTLTFIELALALLIIIEWFFLELHILCSRAVESKLSFSF